jgi:hypothetical protein
VWSGCDEIAPLPEAALRFLADALLKTDHDKPREADGARPGRLAFEATDPTAAWFRKALANEAGKVATAREGDRHRALLSAARTLGGYLHHNHLTETEVINELTHAGRRAGLPEAEVAATVRDGLSYGKDVPLPWPEKLTRHDGARRPTARGAPSHDGRAVDPRPRGAARRLTLAVICAADIRPEPVRFLVPGVIPRGKLVTLAGLGGQGKGMFLAALVADLTRGRPPIGTAGPPANPCNVLMLGCEDGYRDTIIPRLLAAGADVSRVHVLEGVRDEDGHLLPFSLAHLQPLDDHLAAAPDVRLLTIDPITGYVGRAGVRDHHDAELRAVLEPLAELADRRAVTIITVKHLNKDEAKSVSGRVGGSIAYVNVPRACFVVAADPGDENRRVLAPFKWNLNAPQPPALAWVQEPAPAEGVAAVLAACDHLSDEDRDRLRGQLFRLAWGGPVEIGADDLLRSSSRPPAVKAELDRATEWLRDRLSSGPAGSLVIAMEGDRALGRPWPPRGDNPEQARLARAKWWRESVLKPRLNGESHRAGFNGPYLFRLPEHAERGLWPPPADAVAAARAADREDAGPGTMTVPSPVEAVEAVESGGRERDSTRGHHGYQPPPGNSQSFKASTDTTGGGAVETVPWKPSLNRPASTDTTDTTGAAGRRRYRI